VDRLSSFAVDPVAWQLACLNFMLFVYLVCKGVNYVSSVFLRRDPPRRGKRELIRSELARPDES
jgi:hypothetical protein